MEYFVVAYGAIVSILFVCCTRWGRAYTRMIGMTLFPLDEKAEDARSQLAVWLLACALAGGLFFATWTYWIIPTLKQLPEQERSPVFRQLNR